MRGFRGTRATLNQIAARYGTDHHVNFKQYNGGPGTSQQPKQRPELPEWLRAPAGLNAAAPKKKERPQLKLVVSNPARAEAAAPAKAAKPVKLVASAKSSSRKANASKSVAKSGAKRSVATAKRKAA